MGAILTQEWLSQPTAGALISNTAPGAHRLVDAVLANSRRSVRSVVPNAATPVRAGLSENGFYPLTTASKILLPRPAAMVYDNTTCYTVFSLFGLPATRASCGGMTVNGGSEWPSSVCTVKADGNLYIGHCNNSALTETLIVTGVELNKLYVVAWTKPAGASPVARCSVNGGTPINVPVPAGGTYGAEFGFNAYLSIGTAAGGYATFNNLNGLIYSTGVYASVLFGDLQLRHLTAGTNIWQLFDSSALDLNIPDAAGGATYNDSITEALTLADAATVAAILAASRTEAATLADSPSSAAILTAAGSEAITAADVITAALVGAAAASEAASLADARSAAAIYAAAAAESVTLTDAPTSAAIYASSITDALTLADIGSLGLIASITETLALSDSATATLIAASAISEAMTLADAGSSAAIRAATALESLSLTDSIAAAGIFASSVVDALALADLVAESGSGGPVLATDLNYLLKYPSGGFYILRPRNNWTIQ